MHELECPKDFVLQEDLEKVVAMPIAWDMLDHAMVMVTGATGLIGSLLVRTLLTANRIRNCQMRVIAMVRSQEKANQVFGDLLNHSALEIFVGDVTKPISLNGTVDYIFHTASITASKEFVTHPVETIEVAVDGTKNILSFAKQKRCKSLVYLSSMEVYGTVCSTADYRTNEDELGYIDLLKVRSCYPEGKRLCENMCVCYYAQYGVPVKIARLAQTFGAGVQVSDNRIFAQFARAVIAEENIVLHTKGRSSGNYCYTADAISGLITILLQGKNSEAYNIVSEKATTTIVQMAQMVSEKISGGNSKVVFDIPDDTLTYGYASDVNLQLSSKKLEALGWRPMIAPDLEIMYERLIASFRIQTTMGITL